MGKKITPESQTSVDNNVVVEKPKRKRTKKTAPVVEEAATATTADVDNTEIVETTTADVDNAEIVENNTNTTDEAVPEEVVANEEEKTVEKKKRRIVSKETFLKSAEELQKEIIPLLEENNNKKLQKMFKVFMNDAFRLLRIKTHQKKQKDATNSGFMRPVKASSALENFLSHIGEDTTKPLTRAHLTTVICKYIKENDLQNPKDRRIIFPDEEFKKLFQITEDDTEPLTYYNIQKRIQAHVSRIEDVVA